MQNIKYMKLWERWQVPHNLLTLVLSVTFAKRSRQWLGLGQGDTWLVLQRSIPFYMYVYKSRRLFDWCGDYVHSLWVKHGRSKVSGLSTYCPLNSAPVVFGYVACESVCVYVCVCHMHVDSGQIPRN